MYDLSIFVSKGLYLHVYFLVFQQNQQNCISNKAHASMKTQTQSAKLANYQKFVLSLVASSMDEHWGCIDGKVSSRRPPCIETVSKFCQ